MSSGYVLVNLAELSAPQISKLLNGRGVRVKAGNRHSMHLSKEQAKKLHRAHLKGAASTLILDPFQIQHLKGRGFWEDAGAALKPGTKETLKFVAANAPALAAFGATAAGYPQYADEASLAAELTVPLWQDKVEGWGLKKRRGRPSKKIHGGAMYGMPSNLMESERMYNQYRGLVPTNLQQSAALFGRGKSRGGSMMHSAMMNGSPSDLLESERRYNKIRIPMNLSQVANMAGYGKVIGGAIKSSKSSWSSTAAKLLKPLVKEVAKIAIEKGAEYAGPAAAALAEASGHPELAPYASLIGEAAGNAAASSAKDYMDRPSQPTIEGSGSRSGKISRHKKFDIWSGRVFDSPIIKPFMDVLPQLTQSGADYVERTANPASQSGLGLRKKRGRPRKHRIIGSALMAAGH